MTIKEYVETHTHTSAVAHICIPRLYLSVGRQKLEKTQRIRLRAATLTHEQDVKINLRDLQR